MNTVRKIFASALVLATIVSVSGINFAKAAAMDGDLIKMNGLSTVYYYKGGKRYVFPQQNTYMSWFTDFNNVKTVAQSELESYPLGANVTVRPGTSLIKITTNPTVYAVEPGGKLRSIVSEANASSLFGSNWAKKVIDVSDAFFTNYQITSALTAGVYPAGSLVKGSSADVYYFDGTNFRKFASEAAFYANKFNFAFVQTAPAAMTMTPMGTDITGNESGLTDLTMGASGTVSGSGLSVALSSDTPASANVTKGATRVTYTKFNVTAANDGDVRLDTVVITRGGVGSAADFDNVYLYDGMTRLTTGRSVNSSTNQATFSNVNYTVTKGTTKTLSIVADVNASATTGNDNFSISLASAIAANGATVSGSFPVAGNTMSITNVSGGAITIAKTGSLSSPKAGELQAQVAAFTLQASSTEDLMIKNLTLYQVGNIQNGNMTNFNLKQAGTTLATAASMNSNGTIVLNFSTPYALNKGITKTFEVYADVASAARSGDTSIIYLDNSADLYATGNTYGYGAAVTRTGYDNTVGTPTWTDASYTTIEAGQVTLSFQGPSVTDYAVQQQDAEIFRFTMNAKSNIEVRSLGLTLDAPASASGGLSNGGTTANYTDIKFTDVTTGQLLAGPKDVSGTGVDTSQLLTYSDTWTINANQTRTIKVTADIANFTPAANESIKATLSAFGVSAIKNLDTNQYVALANIVPSTAIAGNTHRVKAGTVTLSLAGTPATHTYINGSAAVAMTGINIAAGTGKDIKLTSLMLTATGANGCSTPANCVLNVKLWDGTNQVGETKSLSGTTVTFSNLNVPVLKGATKTLLATVDLNTLSTPIAGSTTLKLDVASTSDATVQDTEGNSVNVSGTVTGPTHTIVASGTLSAALAPDDAESESRLVIAGSDNEVLGKIKFTATREDLRIAKVRVEVPAPAIEEVSSLSLWNGSTKITNDVSLTSGTPNYADFNSFTTDFIVPKDGNLTLTVKGTLNTISNGATSGTTISATLSNVAGTFEARGLNGSNTVLSESDVTALPLAAHDMYLRKTKLTVSQSTLTGTLINGTANKLYEFTVAADSKEDVSLKQIVLDVTLSDNVGTNDTLTAGTFKIYRGSTDISSNVDIHQIDGTTIESINSLAEGTSQAFITWASEEVIAKGTSNTYSVWATPSGFSHPADKDGITVNMRNDSAAQGATYTYLNDVDATAGQTTVSLGILANPYTTLDTAGAAPTLGTSPTNNVIWSDNSVVAHSAAVTANTGALAAPTSSADWYNTYLIKNFPFGGTTLTQ
ncbi:MAG: hypothetical protein NTY12_01855 [Candidatus Falkowbacteria bacterium]|nr:hypothetical protein [Candidatus Falkowbacteria bacterium]